MDSELNTRFQSRLAPGEIAPSYCLVRYAPAALLVAILIADSNRHSDPDLWGHLCFGQAFIADHQLLHLDIYSYSAAGAHWYDHEWLAEIMMASVYDVAGIVGLKLWKFALTTLTLLAMVDAQASTGAPPSLQLAVLLLASIGLILQAQFRPQMFSMALLAVLLALLTRDNFRRKAHLWLAVPLMTLWANLHGGFVVGIAVVALYSVIATVQELLIGADWRRVARLPLLTLVCTTATLANPYGVGMWRTVAHALRNPYTHVAIRDWQPLWWAIRVQWSQAPSGAVLYIAGLAMIAALAIACVAAPRKGDLPLIAVASMMAVAAWVSARNLALAVIATNATLTYHLRPMVASRGDCEATLNAPSRMRTQVPILALAAAMLFQGGLISPRLYLDRIYPAAALTFMREHGLHGNILCEFAWGEYLIWSMGSHDKIFIDGRYDTVYPMKIIRDYFEFYFDAPGADSVLDSYPHDFVLIQASTPARRLMRRRSDWALLFSDGETLLYARANASASKTLSRRVNAAIPTEAFP